MVLFLSEKAEAGGSLDHHERDLTSSAVTPWPWRSSSSPCCSLSRDLLEQLLSKYSTTKLPQPTCQWAIAWWSAGDLLFKCGCSNIGFYLLQATHNFGHHGDGVLLDDVSLCSLHAVPQFSTSCFLFRLLIVASICLLHLYDCEAHLQRSCGSLVLVYLHLLPSSGSWRLLLTWWWMLLHCCTNVLSGCLFQVGVGVPVADASTREPCVEGRRRVTSRLPGPIFSSDMTSAKLPVHFQSLPALHYVYKGFRVIA